MIKMRLYTMNAILNNDKASDGLIINFNSNGNNNLDQNDALKFYNADENIARNVDGDVVSIESRALPENGETLELFTSGYSAEDYAIVFELQNMDSDIDTYFVDHYTNEMSLLEQGINQLSFSIDENQPQSLASDRFNLVFENSTLGLQENDFGNGFYLYPTPTDTGLFTINTVGLETNDVDISIYDILGKTLMSTGQEVPADGKIIVNASQLSSGTYIVKLTHREKRFTAKLIIE